MPPGKIAPRLLHDLLTYDVRYEEHAGRNLLASAPPHYDPSGPNTSAVPVRNCRHSLLTKSEQSQPPPVGVELDYASTYKIASICSQCRWHIDVWVKLSDHVSKATPCSRTYHDYPLHHFLSNGNDNLDATNELGSHQKPRRFSFYCSAPQCRVIVQIDLRPPSLSDQDIETLTDQAQLRRRWETAKQLAGERADTTMARGVDAPDYLFTYLGDSLSPTKGKARIPLLNRKFLKTFGKDCDLILNRLGFTHCVETEGDGSVAEVWYLPKPEESKSPLESTLRSFIEDTRYELNSILLNFPESARVGCRHQSLYPIPAQTDMERALGCADYTKVKGRVETQSQNHEDHPYYASLGAVGDFSDSLILWAFSRQCATDMINRSYYFECLQDVANGRNSEELGVQVGVLASQGFTSRRDLEAAYRYFAIDPKHGNIITDANIIGKFKAFLSDISPLMVNEARRQLRVIGDARGSAKIRAEADEAIETEEQALAWLDLDTGTSDEFVQSLFMLKTTENPSCIEAARKAVTIIANNRQSHRLLEFLEKGTMSTPEMDIGEAYALFSVDDRTSKLDLDVLQTFVDIAPLEDAPKLQKAFAIIKQDQAQNFNNKLNDPNQPDARRNQYPLESWPVGLRNIGNTCYLNSVLQFLFTIRPLRDLILDCESHMQDLTPENLSTKKVGRTAVTYDRVKTAQKFVRELRAFFEHMITAPSDRVKPAIDLASLALCRTDRPEEMPLSPVKITFEDEGLGTIDGVAISGPIPPSNGGIEPTTPPPEVIMTDEKDDVKSISSMQAMDLGDLEERPAPPTRPPPVPPRPEVQHKTKIGIVEESARQQDAAEVMGNIFDLISCAIKGEDVLRDGEQLDDVKKLFFSDVTTVRETAKGSEKLSELRHNHLVSPGGRDRHLYATLDDDFGREEVDDGASRYDYIDTNAPIQIINVRRIQWNRERKEQEYDRSHISLDSMLYLDRYLGKTESLHENALLELRKTQWAKQKELREVNRERSRLQSSEIDGMNLVEAIEETSAFISNLRAEIAVRQTQAGQSSLPTSPPELADALYDRAKHLKEDAGELDTRISVLESQIDTVFQNCNDHPYRLHAVFTHRGASTKGGHYWIYIYDFQNSMWRSYNDDRVEPVDEKEVVDRDVNQTFPRASTGVVYIRADLVDKITQAVCRKPEKPVEFESHQEPGNTPQDVEMMN